MVVADVPKDLPEDKDIFDGLEREAKEFDKVPFLSILRSSNMSLTLYRMQK